MKNEPAEFRLEFVSLWIDCLWDIRFSLSTSERSGLEAVNWNMQKNINLMFGLFK